MNRRPHRLLSLILSVAFLAASGTGAVAELGCVHHVDSHGDDGPPAHSEHHDPASSGDSTSDDASHDAHGAEESSAHEPHEEDGSCNCVGMCVAGAAGADLPAGDAAGLGEASAPFHGVFPAAAAGPRPPVAHLLPYPNAPPFSS